VVDALHSYPGLEHAVEGASWRSAFPPNVCSPGLNVVDIGSVTSTRRVPLEVERESSAPQFLPSHGACCSDVIVVGTFALAALISKRPFCRSRATCERSTTAEPLPSSTTVLTPESVLQWKYVSTLLKS
jgi:hypothetical protein